MIRTSQKVIKRIMDICLSFVGLVFSMPFFIIIFILIRLSSSGPAIFKQRRLGKNANPFKINKFRTMYVGAPDLRNPDGSSYNSPEDARLTRFGKLIRKWSLDELPDLFNVLRGDMSLVGPRPDQIDQIKYYTKEEKKRLSVKPGITGWAQIQGRNVIPWSERKKLDLEYIENYSIWLDIRIMINTIFYVLKRRDIFVSEKTDISR